MLVLQRPAVGRVLRAQPGVRSTTHDGGRLPGLGDAQNQDFIGALQGAEPMSDQEDATCCLFSLFSILGAVAGLQQICHQSVGGGGLQMLPGLVEQHQRRRSRQRTCEQEATALASG